LQAKAAKVPGPEKNIAGVLASLVLTPLRFAPIVIHAFGSRLFSTDVDAGR